MPIIKFLFLLVRLLSGIVSFIASLIFFYLKNLIKKHQVSALIYLLVITQVFLLSIQVINTSFPNLNQSIDSRLNQEFINENFKNNFTNLYSISGNKDDVIKELSKYQAWHKKQPSHRDLLINQALLYLSLGDKIKYEQHITQAKKVDPSWNGWK